MPEGFRIASAFVQVSPDTEGFKEELKAKLDEAAAGVEGKVKVTLDTADLSAKADDARAKLDELSAKHAAPKVGLDGADLDAKTDEAKAKIDELDAKKARPEAGLVAADLDAKVDEVKAKLDELDAKHVDPKIGLNTADFDAKLDEARAKLAAFRGESANARIGATGGVGEAAGGGGEGGIGMLMPGLAAGLTGLLPGVGGAATGLGLLGGTGALALGGVSKALGDAHQASMNVGLTNQQLAATEFSNSVQIQSAQQAVTQARQQSAQDAVTSAHSIESAQMNLASVERNAAESQVQALHSVEQAQQGLESANYGLSEAQYNLNQAWVQAREQIIQLNDQLADSKLNVQSAQLAIQQAIYQQRLVDQNAYSTQIDREQAALAVVRAQQQLKDASDQETNSQYAANLANRQGVEHSQTVIQAKQALIQATYGQKNAQFQYVDAQRQLTLTELNNAQQVKAAQMQVAATEEQAAYQRMRDAQQVAIAERNVSNTIKEQQLQMAATMSTSNQAANQFAKDMARMTPAGRALVNQILGMRDGFKGLEAAAQNATAPGFTKFLQGIQALLPTIQSGVTKMGTAISNAFGQFGKELATPAAAKVLNGLIDNGIRFANIVLPAFAAFAGALAKVGSQKGAVDGLANVLAGLGNGLTNVVNAISPFTGVLSSVFSTLGSALAPIGTLLGQTVGSLAQALAPALQALLPGFNALVGALGQGLSIALKSLAPVLKPVADALSAIAMAFAPLLPVIGQLIAQVAQALAPVLRAVVPVIKQLAQLLVKDLQDGLFQTIKAIMPLLPVVGKLIISLMPLISVVLKVAGVIIDLAAKLVGPLVSAIVYVVKAILDFVSHWQVAVHWIETGALWLWHNVFDPMWHGIADGSIWFYQNAILPLWHGIQTAFGWIENAAKWMWHNVFDPLWQGIEAGARGFVDAFQTVWHGLEDVFKTPVNFLINPVYSHIRSLWDDVVEHIGLSKLDLPDIKQMAHGGVVPGYAPGHDTVPAMLSPGEAVLTPGAARALGYGNIEALNMAHRPGGARPPAGHFGWGLNPIDDMKQIGHDVASGFGKVADIAKIAAALVTGNGTALSNALGKFVGTNALGDYAKMMIGVPKELIKDAVKALLNTFSSSGSGHGTSNAGGFGGTPVGPIQQYAQSQLARFGWGSNQMGPLINLWNQESSWNPNAVNPSSGAYGIPQALGHGHPYNLGDYVAQINWGLDYIAGRYGSPASAWAHEQAFNWYDQGGWLMPNTMPVNGLRKPEAVLTPQESEAFVQIVRQLTTQGAGASPLGSKQATVNFYGTSYPNVEQMAAIKRDLALALGGAS